MLIKSEKFNFEIKTTRKDSCGSGAVDTTFNTNFAGANGIIDCVAIQNDGKIIITGNFTTYNGTPANRIARLTANGTIDTSFNVGTGFDNNILATNSIANFKKILFTNNVTNGTQDIYICGAFNTYNGTQSQNIVKITSTGAINPSFSGKASSKINDMVFLAGSAPTQMYIGGQFSGYNGTLPIEERRLARISTTNGNRVPTFYSNSVHNFNNIVNCLALQPDGRLIVGGAFTTYNGFQANGITRISTGQYNQGNQGKMSDSINNDIIINNDTTIADDLIVYPNPSNGIFKVDLTNQTKSFETLSVFNILGQKILTQTIKNKSINEIDLTNFAQGVYVVVLKEDATNVLQQKLIIE